MSKETISIQDAFAKAGDFDNKPLLKGADFKEDKVYKFNNFRKVGTEFGAAILCTVDDEINYFLPKRFSNLLNANSGFDLCLDEKSELQVKIKEFKKYKNTLTPIFEIVKFN